MKKLLSVLFWLLLLSGVAYGQEKKLALIIGNSNYSSGAILKNPINDANAMDSTLQSLGFTTMKYENLRLPDFKKAIDDFGKQLQHYEVGLFYYAGHGIQFKGRNYLIPVDANLEVAQQIEYDCVEAGRVLAFMEAAQTKINLLILDACRNNPFDRSWSRGEQGGGLAFMNAPTGSLIAYATAPGTVASDGSANNGLYTSSLLKHIATPDLTVEQVFKRVRMEVEEKTNKGQVPWESTSLKGEFYFSKTENAGLPVTGPVQQISRDSATATREIIKSVTMKRNAVRLQVEVPILFGVGYGYQFGKHFSAELQAGLISDPNMLMNNKIESQSDNTAIAGIMNSAFKYGILLEGGVNFHFSHNYVGAFAQTVSLKGAETQTSVVENYFSRDLSVLPIKPGGSVVVPQTVTITSKLMNLGILYGRILPLKNSWQIRIEFALTKNFTSTSKVDSEDRDLTSMNGDVDKEFDYWYSKYAYVPSLTVGIVKTFGKVTK